MSYSRIKFDEAVWRIVSNIKPGSVMSYGEVAKAAGFPRHSRMESQSMGRCKSPLPWYRVIRSDRTLAFEVDSKPYLKQKTLLENEGVKINKRKVITAHSETLDDLDKLLWGPPDK